jgi:hypothetical protein
MATFYSCKHLLLCVIVLFVVVFRTGMVDAADDKSALRGAIQKAMTGCVSGKACISNSDCGTEGECVSYALLY